MAFELTSPARLASQKINLEPQLILEIEGVDSRFGVRVINKKTKIGDRGLKFDGSWKIGGKTQLFDQASIISLASTTTTINQQLDPSKGSGSSISAMQVALVDKDGYASELVSPGIVVDDILGRSARVYLGFQETLFPDDFVVIFRGVIDDIQAKPGIITLNIAHPDQKKRQTLFAKTTMKVTGTAQPSQLFPSLQFAPQDLAQLYRQFQGGAYETYGLKSYFKFDDEFIRFWFAPEPYGVHIQRAQLGSVQNPDETLAVGSELETFYTLEGNVIDLALRLMLSDKESKPYITDVPVASIGTDGALKYQNGFFFNEDVESNYGVRIGDFMTITGSVHPENNTVATTPPYAEFYSTITEIIKIPRGSVVLYDPGQFGISPTPEIVSAAKAKFKSQYNVLRVGLGLRPDEVDIDEHLKIKKLFLSNFDLLFYMKDEVNLKEFIEEQLYAVAGAYSLPRKSKASIGLHVGPIPGAQTAIISATDITNVSDLIVRRSISRNFTNTIIYKFDEQLTEDEFLTGIVTTDEDSINRIKVGTKASVIEARGLRLALNGEGLARTASARKLNRYKYGAEYIENMGITFKKGFNLEIGDIFLLDAKGLKLLNSKLGNREPEPKLYEIINKAMNLRTGEIKISFVDTSFSTAKRYALVSPASRIKSGISQTKFVIEQAFASQFGASEYLKWQRYLEGGSTVGVKVRSADSSQRFETTIKKITGNEIEVTDDLGFVPQAGFILEFADYDYPGTTAVQKSLYGYMQNLANFPSDGGLVYSMF